MTAGDPIRVGIVDDQPLLRRTLSSLVAAEAGMEVAGEAADGQGALDLARSERPDVMLVDVRMPTLDGVRATAAICADPELAGVRVVILTMFELEEYVYGALRAGASAFLLKDAPPERIVEAIRRVHDGETLLAPSVLADLIDRHLGGRANPGGIPASITPREREVLALVGAGLSNSQIEERLRISHGTCKSHISALLSKLAARDRAQLVIAAYEAGLAGPRARA